ncbi:sufE-like protein 2, chloroplastic [Phoenix dactylifera]|uniref:SufE-like protein 2, chloroplastic n=1 Tax=Phoenix dactylifera TaxID=42345 RepID=A0A8B7D2M7_PHODC|nr:sufE-like protein 2, chloroplastic [Phoenix dactylifera]
MDSAALATRLLHAIPNRNSSSPFLSTRCRPSRRRLSLSVRCIQIPNPTPGSLLPCSAVAAREAPAADRPRLRLHRLVDEFRSLPQPIDRVKRLLAYGSALRPFPEAARVSSNRVEGCTAQVWVTAALDDLGRMRFAADSDSEITKGFCSCLISVLDGALPEEVLEVRPEDFGDLDVAGMPARAKSRVNTWHNVLISTQKRTEALIAEGEGRPSSRV